MVSQVKTASRFTRWLIRENLAQHLVRATLHLMLSPSSAPVDCIPVGELCTCEL